MADPVPSAFNLQELGGDGRLVVLQARALPYRPFTLSGTQRVEFTSYPGSPTTSAQVLGASEGDTELKGMWKDVFIAPSANGGFPPATVNGVPIQNAADLVDLFDDIRQKGQVLLVTWDRIAREGLMTEFVQSWDRIQDVTWTAKFTWISKGEPIGGASFGPEVDMAQYHSQLAQLMDVLSQKIAPPFSADQTLIGDVIQAADKMTSQINNAGDTVNAVGDALLSPADAARRTVGILGSLQDNAQEVLDHMASKTTLALLDTQDQLTATVATYLKAATYKVGVVAGTKRVRAQAAVQRVALAARASSPVLIATVVAKLGQDLRQISAIYYGTPNQWIELAAYNKLTSSKLIPGTVIHVPTLRAKS